MLTLTRLSNICFTSRIGFVKYCRRYENINKVVSYSSVVIPKISYLHYSRHISCCLFSSFTSGNDESSDDEDEIYDEAYEDLVRRSFRTPDAGHQVYVIQPFIKWGPSKKTLTNPDYQLGESVALIESLSNWKAVDSLKVSLTTFRRTKFFGKGNLEKLQMKIRSNELITAVFISVNRLTYVQQEVLEEIFGVPVYDRFNIVMQIFREHAVTKEAKLQVAMAEIPFLWYRIKSYDDTAIGLASKDRDTTLTGETVLELKKRLLTTKEQKIKKALKALASHRELLRNKRKKREFPVVAVVGYTNAGKTSLIKALTGAEKLIPKNYLFATLDVTVHEGVLPSNVKVLYVDTIGFISDIPTELIEPFNVTLEDAVQADLLVHVMDISHPDVVAQADHVVNTFRRLKLDNKLVTNVINVANKCDLMSENDIDKLNKVLIGDGFSEVNRVIKVSCLKNTGLNELREKVEQVLLNLTGRIRIRIRVNNGGPEFSWLYKESAVVQVLTDEKFPQLVYLDVVITETNLMRFKHIFISSKQYNKSER